MNLQIVGLHTHDDESPFDDLDRGRRMVATVLESAVIDSAAHPDCEAIEVEPLARGTVYCEKYETEAVVRVIKKFIRDKEIREN